MEDLEQISGQEAIFYAAARDSVKIINDLVIGRVVSMRGGLTGRVSGFSISEGHNTIVKVTAIDTTGRPIEEWDSIENILTVK